MRSLTYMELAHGRSLVPEDAVTLRLIFEGAAQLGVFDRAKPRRSTWPEKLWALGAHWGLQETLAF